MEEAGCSNTIDPQSSSDDTYEFSVERSSTGGRIDALNYVSDNHPLLPPKRARSADSLTALRSRVRHHTAFWWDVFLAMQEDKNSDDYQALRSELAKLRQENERLKKNIKKIRLQSIKDKTTIDYLGRATPLTREMQVDIADAVKKRKRKRDRIAADGDDSEGDDHGTNIILKEQLRRLQKENKAGQARLKVLEAAVDKFI